MDALKKILFIHPDLKGGGAEKVLVDLLNSLSEEKYDITLFTIFEEGVNRKKLKPGIKQFSWFKKVFRGYSVLQKFIPPILLARWIAKKEQYDIVVAYLEHVPTRIASAFPSNTKKISWLHLNASPELLSRTFKNYQEMKSAYLVFDAIICVSSLAKQAILNAVPELDENKVQVIENTFDIGLIEESAGRKTDIVFSKDFFNLVSIGRLVEMKGYDRLLRVVVKLKNEGLNFKLYILGDGIQRNKLQQFIAENQLQNNVVLLGFQENPYAILKQADLYVCSSYNEGYNTAIIEALLLEIPVLTTDCSGMSEILDEGKYGIITENCEEDLFDKLLEILSSEEKLKQLKIKAIERRDFFVNLNATAKVEHLFDTI
jgi:glycosyltransferase involved in cell wall biosynthesis